jgi:anti-anti-sigma regulatory factor
MMAKPPDPLAVVILDGVVVVQFLVPQITDGHVENIGKELLRQTATAVECGRKLLLNFQGVERMCEAMVGKLVLLNKRCRDLGIQLKFCNVPRDLIDPTGGLSGLP